MDADPEGIDMVEEPMSVVVELSGSEWVDEKQAVRTTTNQKPSLPANWISSFRWLVSLIMVTLGSPPLSDV